MNKLSFTKQGFQKTIIHPSLVNFYGRTSNFENGVTDGDANPLYPESSQFANPPSKPQYIRPHTWEFTDYDDDHFELL